MDIRMNGTETVDSREDFQMLVERHARPLFRLAYRMSGSQTDAEDLVQDTYVKALRFADRFERGTNLRAWLYTILHNTWRNRVRDRAREGVQVDSELVEQEASRPDGPSVFDTPERILLRSTLDADLQEALAAIPEAFREAVWLRDVEEFSYAEIAEVLGRSEGSLRVAALRVKEKIKKKAKFSK